MLSLIFGSIAIICAVFAAEYLGRKNILGKESSRKIPHIVISLAIASIAFFIDISILKMLLVLDALIIILVIKFNLLPIARSVDRLTWGELFFPLGLIASVFISPNRWIFVTSVLVMGLADAAAALVGKTIGKHQYTVFGCVKSYEGSAAFFVTALVVIGLVVFVAPSGLEATWTTVILLSASATLLEAAAPWGMDNLLLPILVACALKLF